VRPALAYSPGRSALHRAPVGFGLAFLGALAAVAFCHSSPAVLAATGVAAALAGSAAGASRAVAASLRLAVPLLLLMVAVNALVTSRGETVLVRGWTVPVLGSTDVTLEAIIAGLAIGLRVVVVVIVFAVYSACIDPDRVLRLIRPLARRSALTAALVVRMVPLAAQDAARMGEAARLRGPAAAPAGRFALARRLVEGSLDRAVDAAATLELRGHSLAARTEPRRDPAPPSPLMAAAAALLIVAALSGPLLGVGEFDAYPSVSMELDPATVALCLLVPPLALIPFVRLPSRRPAPTRIGEVRA
jgi:energy-coupling factor transport system permease protein